MTTEADEVLSALGIGEKARVLGFDLPPEHRQRLLEMGLTVGVECEVMRFAPMGDPIDIKVRGYQLSLRKKEAGGVRVVRI